VLYHTVVPLCTRRLILDRNTVLRLYTAKIISDILVKAHKSYFITEDYAGGDLYYYSYNNFTTTITNTTSTVTTINTRLERRNIGLIRKYLFDAQGKHFQDLSSPDLWKCMDSLKVHWA